MTATVNTILYPTSDIAASKALFTRLLGVEPAQDAPYYVGFEVAGMTIGLDPSGEERGVTGATSFFEVADIKAALAEMKAAGCDVAEDVKAVGGGRTAAMISCPTGPRKAQRPQSRSRSSNGSREPLPGPG